MAELGIAAIASSGAEWMAYCREAERTGVGSVWSSDLRDAFVDAGLALSCTERLRVGSAVALPTRTPLQTARAVQSLAEWGDRFTLGLGPGHSAEEGAVSEKFFRLVGAGSMEDAHGLPFAPAVARMRDFQTCVTALLHGELDEPVDLVLEHFRVSGRGFGYDRERLPTMLGAYGPRMVTLSGEISDGLNIHHVSPRAATARKAAQARKAHAESGSDAPFWVGFGTLVSAHADEKVALEVARAEVVGAFAMPPYLSRLADDHPELVEQVQPLIDAEDYAAAAAAVPEDVIRDLIVVTTPDRLRDDIAAFDAGVDECLLLPAGVFAPMVGDHLGLDPGRLAEVHEAMLRGVFGGVPTAAGSTT